MEKGNLSNTHSDQGRSCWYGDSWLWRGYKQLHPLDGAKSLEETIGEVIPLFQEFTTSIQLQEVKDQIPSFGQICSVSRPFQLDGKCFFIELKSNLGELFNSQVRTSSRIQHIPAEIDSRTDSCRVLGIPVIGEKEPDPQSSVVSKHFCFKLASSANVGTELVTASTENGAGGEMSRAASPVPCPSFLAKDSPLPTRPSERTQLCGTIHRGVIMDAGDT